MPETSYTPFASERRGTGAAHRTGETHARLQLALFATYSYTLSSPEKATPCIWKLTIAATPRSRTPSAT